MLVALAVLAGPTAAQARLHLRHHGDPKSAFRHAWGGPFARAASLPVLPTTWCGTEHTSDVGSPLSDAPQIKVVYAYAADQPDRFSSYANVIQSDVSAIRARVDTESNDTKSVRFDLGNGSSGCASAATAYADIQVVHLPQSLATYRNATSTFSTLKADLLAALGSLAPGARMDYLVYADRINRASAPGVAGEADTPIDDSHGYGNGVNRGPNGDGRLVAVLYGFDSGSAGDFVNGAGPGSRDASFLHEMSHTQGAVQSSAPHSTGAGHCYDAHDIMCYNDLGPNWRSEIDCPSGSDLNFSAAFDCNKDDYFSPSPAAGSYLATHWNEYDSVFFCAVANCDSAIGAPTVSLSAPGTAYRGSPVTLTANVSGATIERYEWDLNNDGIYDVDTGTGPTTTQQFAANGPQTVRVRATTADGVFGTDVKTIAVSEPATPSPSFTVSSGTPVAGAPVTFDAGATSDPSGVITNYRWDLDGDGTTDFDGGATLKTATTTFATPGARVVTLEIDYPLGLSKVMGQVTIGSPGSASTAKPPRLTASTVRLAALLRSGLPLTATCGAACTVSAQLTLGGAAAKALHLKAGRGKSLTVGSLSRRLPAAGTLKAAVRLTPAVARALKHARRVTLTLTASVRQTGFSALTLQKMLTIRR